MWVGFAALLITGAAVLAYQTRNTTFWADEWAWIIARRSGAAGTFLHPHNEHLSLVPVTIYKLLFATVGLRHYAPYRAALIVADLACVSLVFVYVRRRLGGFLALLAGALIELFGPGWQDILWPFGIGWLIAIAAGVGALLLLDRRDRPGDVGAAVLLMIALASAGPGLAMAVGVAVEVLQRPRRRSDAWIFLAPLALYALWWVIYQHTSFNRHALPLLPRFVFDAAAGALSSLTGLANVDVFHDTGTYLTWGAPLLVIALIALIWRMRTRGAAPRVLTLLAILLSFWILTGAARAYVTLGPIAFTASGARLPDYARQTADSQLIKIQRLGLVGGTTAGTALGPEAPRIEATAGGIATTRGPCLGFRPAVYTPAGSQNLLTLTVPAAGLLLKAGTGALTVGVGRFSTQFEQLGTVAGSGSATLRPARDVSAQPWRVQILSGAPFSACSLG